jgi:hypothetical protein
MASVHTLALRARGAISCTCLPSASSSVETTSDEETTGAEDEEVGVGACADSDSGSCDTEAAL